ncbi:unnamed protein product [Miscanthus lutarioriparius]|uniref:Pectin lyase-like superfamily protein n=1 Tax=Miscanthus lutarioriparius TaxID=422564 RepID=A0A811N361_9POAL|nr:unnamed protein product [Miscanthus lutarioriparius]
MASRTNKPQLQLVLWPSLLTLLFLSGALEAAAGTGTSTSSVSSIGSSADGAAAATGRRSLAAASQSVFNLDRYGASGDGSHDDTQALAQAWNAACTSPRPSVLLVPGGKRYLLKLVTLHGPCKSSFARS